MNLNVAEVKQLCPTSTTASWRYGAYWEGTSTVRRCLRDGVGGHGQRAEERLGPVSRKREGPDGCWKRNVGT